MKNKSANNINLAMTSFKELYGELQEINDRAVVIVGAANIDCLLEKLLINSMIKPYKKVKKIKDDELFGTNSPLSSFSAKINLCYRVVLIDKTLCSVLHIIRDIRNDFAHKIKGCDLDIPPYSDKIDSIAKYFDVKIFEEIRNYFPGSSSISKDFRIIMALISSLLEIKLLNIPKKIKANPVSISWLPSIDYGLG